MIKPLLRKKFLEIRKKKYSSNLLFDNNRILKILINSNLKKKVIGGYYPYNFEFGNFDLLKTLEKKKYKISLPKITSNNQMNFYEWSFETPLSINTYGIPEPISNKIVYPDALLVPFVAFDKSRNRLGYGGGYYDRYIAKIKKKKNVITIGLGFSFQRADKLPFNKNDIKLNYIITEKNIF